MSADEPADVAEFTVQVKRPIEVVYAFLANMENFGMWFPAVLSIESDNDLAHGVTGKQYLEDVRVPLKGTQRIPLVVVEAVAPTRFATEGDFPPLLPRMSIELHSQNSGQTEIEWRMQSRNSSRLFRAVLLPVVRVVMRRRAAQASQALIECLA